MSSNNNNVKQIVSKAMSIQRDRENSYRERALKLFPWICGRCRREFNGKRLRELTVHHRDHNHDNNPPDGSNWELLCIYCHDNEHARDQVADAYDKEPFGKSSDNAFGDKPFDNKPFAGLADLLKSKLP
ncbi:MAG: HNH nuclease family protein [Desulfobacterales bacterium]|nr:HNH nuclease family protein [Desulfobacterales bacterium]MBF0396482.1 HNH nuclease family protein [Desulfobacterales bacterium]